jgi:hypothetical protein
MATPADNWVSPHFTEADKGSTPDNDALIEVFRDRIDGWQLSIAEEMLRQIEDSPLYPAMKHAAYALISVVFSYFEMVGQLVKMPGKKTGATDDFVAGFEDVYPAWKGRTRDIETVYDRIRCGMFHNGYTKRGVYIDGDYTVTFELKSGIVQLNPHTLVRDLRKHFTALTTRLEIKTNSNLRSNLIELLNRAPKK